MIVSDIKAWSKYRGYADEQKVNQSFFNLLALLREFMIQFRMRLSRLAHFVLGYKGLECCSILDCKHIGREFCLMHGIGVVVNPKTIIGNNCTLLQNVTLGELGGNAPIIGNNVLIGAGAIVLGGTHR